MGEHGGDHLRLVLEAGREQRPDRAVDEAGGERLLLGRAPLALEIAARDLAGGKGLLLVIHGQGEEVDAGPGFLGGNGGGEHGGAAILGEHRAVGLAADAAGLELEGAAPPFDLYGLFVQHDDVSMSRERVRPSVLPEREGSGPVCSSDMPAPHGAP